MILSNGMIVARIERATRTGIGDVPGNTQRIARLPGGTRPLAAGNSSSAGSFVPCPDD
jgi:hypothetical protein